MVGELKHFLNQNFEIVANRPILIFLFDQAPNQFSWYNDEWWWDLFRWLLIRILMQSKQSGTEVELFDARTVNTSSRSGSFWDISWACYIYPWFCYFLLRINVQMELRAVLSEIYELKFIVAKRQKAGNNLSFLDPCDQEVCLESWRNNGRSSKLLTPWFMTEWCIIFKNMFHRSKRSPI